MSRSNLPVPLGAAAGRDGAQGDSRTDGQGEVPKTERVQAERARRAAAAASKAGAFDAHLLGQDGARRGLKGGAPVLDAARSAYLGTEYSGEADRRPPVGMLKRREI